MAPTVNQNFLLWWSTIEWTFKTNNTWSFCTFPGFITLQTSLKPQSTFDSTMADLFGNVLLKHFTKLTFSTAVVLLHCFKEGHSHLKNVSFFHLGITRGLNKKINVIFSWVFLVKTLFGWFSAQCKATEFGNCQRIYIFIKLCINILPDI